MSILSSSYGTPIVNHWRNPWHPQLKRKVKFFFYMQSQLWCKISLSPSVFLLFSCSVNKTLDGTWENEEKIIYFDSIQKKFVIINKKANKITGFAGEFDFDKYSDSISLTYLYLINNKNDFFMIENNSHEKFYEQLQYNIKNEKLELYNLNLEKSYFFIKSNQEIPLAQKVF